MSATTPSFTRILNQVHFEINPLFDQFNREYLKDIQQENCDIKNKFQKLSVLQGDLMKKIESLSGQMQFYSNSISRMNRPDTQTQIECIRTLNSNLEQKMSEVFEKIHIVEALQKPEQQIPSLPTAHFVKTPSIRPLGLVNQGANCAFNALIQFMVHIPGLKQACLNLPDTFNPLKMMIEKHHVDEISKNDYSRIDSQRLREMLYHVFNKKNPFSGEEVFSLSPYQQEDAYEALMCILSRLKLPVDHSITLFSRIQTTRRYQPTGVSLAANPLKVFKTKIDKSCPDGYSILDTNNCSTIVDQDCQIILDLKNRTHLPFETLVNNFFNHPDIEGSSDAFYLGSDDRLHEYKIKQEFKKFTTVPKEFLLVLKRFSYDEKGTRIKICAPIAVPLRLKLPAPTISSDRDHEYELDGFVQHRGSSARSGHYVAYLKIEGNWIEYNDLQTRVLSEDQLKIFLQDSYFHHYRQIDTAKAAPAKELPPVPARVSRPKSINSDLAAIDHFIDVYSQSNAQNDSYLLAEFYKLPPQCIEEMHFLTWLGAGMPAQIDYGKRECDRNLHILKTLSKPWLSLKGANILEQYFHLAKQKAEIDSQEKIAAQLQAFVELMKNPSIGNDQLRTCFYQLDQLIDGMRICDRFHALVYEADPRDEHEYGKKITDAHVRVLLEISKPILSQQGSCLAEQMIHYVLEKANLAKIALQKDQLEAFHQMLHDYSLSNQQLQRVFQKLSAELKDKLFLAVWIAHGQKDIPQYGEKTILQHVRSLLAIKDPILHKGGGDLIQQLIGLLNDMLR